MVRSDAIAQVILAQRRRGGFTTSQAKGLHGGYHGIDQDGTLAARIGSSKEAPRSPIKDGKAFSSASAGLIPEGQNGREAPLDEVDLLWCHGGLRPSRADRLTARILQECLVAAAHVAWA
jgi:hypothetical protein